MSLHSLHHTTTKTATATTLLYTNYTTLQLQLHHATTTTTAGLQHTTSSNCGWGGHCNNCKHSKKQWIRSAIHASQQLTSPTVSYLWNFRHRLVRSYSCKHARMIKQDLGLSSSLNSQLFPAMLEDENCDEANERNVPRWTGRKFKATPNCDWCGARDSQDLGFESRTFLTEKHRPSCGSYGKVVGRHNLS